MLEAQHSRLEREKRDRGRERRTFRVGERREIEREGNRGTGREREREMKSKRH